MGSRSESKGVKSGVFEGRENTRKRARGVKRKRSEQDVSLEAPTAQIRVGKDYQAVIPDLVSSPPPEESVAESSLLLWKPTDAISDEELDEYIHFARYKYSYNEEQALGLLLICEYDLKKANEELQKITPFFPGYSTPINKKKCSPRNDSGSGRRSKRISKSNMKKCLNENLRTN